MLPVLKQGADLVIFEDALEHWPKETAVKILDTALQAADYVLVSSFIASDTQPSHSRLADLLGRGPVRFAIFNEHTGTDYGTFLLSARDPRRLRSQTAMANIFTQHLDRYVKVGDESLSGPGSSLYQTDEIRQRLPLLVQDISARSFLDAPCGDFNWMRHVTLGVDQYIGIDVVPGLIAKPEEVWQPQSDFPEPGYHSQRSTASGFDLLAGLSCPLLL